MCPHPYMFIVADLGTSAKRNSSYSTYSILFLTYTSYFEGKKGISRNKMKFVFLMHNQHVPPYRPHQQKSTFLIPSYSILLHLIPLILGVRSELVGIRQVFFY